MKIKLKDGKLLPNNWKECGGSSEEWKALNNGQTIEVSSVSDLIKDDVDILESAPKNKQTKQGGK
tara:strand:- start:233 stop:427 length:195 start_codon:yes stop_codon:yes gene_type:complete